MIAKFKKVFPGLFSLLRRVYHKTSLYKTKLRKYEEIRESINLSRREKELEVIENVFNNHFQVQNGPFKNMNYINKSSCSTLIPKLLGSYEESIQDWVNEVITSNKYSKIIDIGSAEGYYAVGFAMKFPNSKILAFDTDESARKNLQELVNVNLVKNVEIKVECTHDELNSICDNKTLIFCDIEGFELELLNPEISPNLSKADLIIESHDCFIPNITETLISRFYKTHKIQINVDYPYRLNKYITPNSYSELQFNYMIDEERPDFMKFLYLKSVYE